MIRGIDHLVIACPHPDAAADELEKSLGLTAAGGGRHPDAGTFNRIVWLADSSYLELIGVDDPDAARRSPVGRAALATLDAQGAGLAAWALSDDDLEPTVRGLPEGAFGPVVRGGRRRPDGEAVEWWVAFPESGIGPDSAPFLIQHAYSGAEWGHAALAERAAYRHPIGSPLILARLDIATGDPPTTAAAIHQQVGIDFWAVADLAVAEIGRHVVRLIPRREMAVPAVVTLAAEVSAPRTVDLLGLRFDVERVKLPVPVDDSA